MVAQQIRPIRTESDYSAALARIDAIFDAVPGTREADELDVLSTLVEVYEDEMYPIAMPDPISAIQFRMEQQGLRQVDLAPYFGSAAKVSEVLSGKRPLTLKMIRSLQSGLGISADVLVQDAGSALPEDGVDVEWERFPLREMVKYGWLSHIGNVKDCAEEVMRSLIESAGGFRALPTQAALYRKGKHVSSKADDYALTAWCLRVLAAARKQEGIEAFDASTVTLEFLRDVAKLSSFDKGPLLAQELLCRNGIKLVFVRHLSKTYLDGAAMMCPDGSPVIGMSLRHDRIDNFWFCLLHELVHVGRHLADDPKGLFVDDLSADRINNEQDYRELEADEWARNALIDPSVLASSTLMENPTVESVKTLAHRINIHPVCIAGRIRWEKKNFKLLPSLTGRGAVRKHFHDQWH